MPFLKTLSLMAVLVAFAAIVVAGTVTQKQNATCLTRDDVLRSQNDSRNGISLTCNESIRQRNIELKESAE